MVHMATAKAGQLIAGLEPAQADGARCICGCLLRCFAMRADILAELR